MSVSSIATAVYLTVSSIAIAGNTVAMELTVRDTAVAMELTVRDTAVAMELHVTVRDSAVAMKLTKRRAHRCGHVCSAPVRMKGKGGRRAHRVRGKEHCKVHKAEGPRIGPTRCDGPRA